MNKKWEQCTVVDKYALFSALITGLFTHLYALTNKIPAIDDLMCVNSFGAGTVYGRWFLEVIGLVKHKLFGNYSAPAWNGIIAILFVGVSAALLCRIFEVKTKLVAALTGMILVTFPAMTSYMLYAYTSYYYCLALALILYAVYLEKQKQNVKTFLIASILIAMGIGIYQAFLPFAIVAFLVILFTDITNDKAVVMATIKKGMFFVLSIIISLLIYSLSNTVLQRVMGIEAGDYKGAGDFGSVLISKRIGIIPYIYHSLIELVTENYYGLTSKPWLGFLIAGLYILVAVIWIYQVVALINKKKSGIAILLVIIGLLLPIGLHSLFIMVEEQYFYTLMLYSDVMLFIIPLVLVEKSMEQSQTNSQLLKCAKLYVVSTTMLACILYSIEASGVYLEMDMSWRSAQAYYTTVVTQIKSLDDYNPDYPVVLVGNTQDSTLYDLEEAYFLPVSIGGARGTKDTVKGVFLDLFLEQYCGYTQKFELDSSNVDEVKLRDMPCYPMPGSIAVIDDRIVVKFSDSKETR
ncbi:MAG: glucosyltransferase domain-containing protein [Lachnospiraceae bacterium]|nr:glucosyltransferase domain-containing protein [Lachnospiraceae bacterium]